MPSKPQLPEFRREWLTTTWMTYNHLRELKAMGYIVDGEKGYIITDAGRIASI